MSYNRNMILEEVIVHFANKTGRNYDQSKKVIMTLKNQADKCQGWVTKHPSNSDYDSVQVWRDKDSGHTLWLHDGVVVNVVPSKKTKILA